jgi:hypothetical protein
MSPRALGKMKRLYIMMPDTAERMIRDDIKLEMYSETHLCGCYVLVKLLRSRLAICRSKEGTEMTGFRHVV